MFLIAHRGNRSGKNLDRENHPDYLLEALAEGYDVELDVWWHEGNFWLGHDGPTYKVPADFLTNPNMWCHAKSLETVAELTKYRSVHWFWHETDKITITSKGCIWNFPNIDLVQGVINQPNDIVAAYNSKPFAICADDFTSLAQYLETME